MKILYFRNFHFFKNSYKSKKIIKNTNCGTCRECKIIFGVFENFRFLKISDFFSFFIKCFGFFGVFVKGIVIFNIGFGFCVFNSIWEHRLKIFFDPQNRKNTTPPKIEKNDRIMVLSKIQNSKFGRRRGRI